MATHVWVKDNEDTRVVVLTFHPIPLAAVINAQTSGFRELLSLY